MSKFFKIIILFSLFLNAGIQNNEKKLEKYKTKKATLSIKLKEVATKILKENRKIKELRDKIIDLEKSIKIQEQLVEDRKDDLVNLIKSINRLKEEQKNIENHLHKIIAKQYAMTIFNQSQKNDNADSLIKRNILNTMEAIIAKDFNKSTSKFMENEAIMNSQILEVTSMKNRINRLKSEKENLTELKKKHDSSLSLLKKQNKNYKDEIVRISNEQEALRATLKKLKIIEQSKIPISNKQKVSLQHIKDIKVRKIGSSYRKSITSKYRGEKTISPLTEYEVIRKFGTYNDPIYQIKLFSESVKLRAKQQDAKVLNVLPGTIVYSQRTKFLGNVVIVKCKKEMNIIYGHLSKISPYIKVGEKVKRGSYIGRVNRDLTFEVTKKNRHINPMRLIRDSK